MRRIPMGATILVVPKFDRTEEEISKLIAKAEFELLASGLLPVCPQRICSVDHPDSNKVNVESITDQTMKMSSTEDVIYLIPEGQGIRELFFSKGEIRDFLIEVEDNFVSLYTSVEDRLRGRAVPTDEIIKEWEAAEEENHRQDGMDHVFDSIRHGDVA